MEDPEEWVDHCRLFQNPELVPEGLVPATQFIFVDTPGFQTKHSTALNKSLNKKKLN